MSFLGQLVTTPYGEGAIADIRQDDTVVVTPNDWELAGKQKPSFYLSPKDVSPVFGEGCGVKTAFGSGKISSIRSEDKQHVIKLDDWKLADGKSPTLYMNQESLQRLTEEDSLSNEVTAATGIENEKKHQEEKFNEIFTKAMGHKAIATEAYKKVDLETAKREYLNALETLQHVTGELQNHQKAKLLEQTVLCNNNLSLSCMRTKNYQQCVAFAKNAMLLISSLESKLDGEIWKCLQESGITIDKLRKEWKKKSLYFMGKGEYLRQNYQNALDSLEQALKLIENDPKLETNAKELKDLISDAQKRRNKEKQKEKNTWSKAFQKNETHVETKSTAAGASKGNAEGSSFDFSKLKLNIPGLSNSSSGNNSSLIKDSDTNLNLGVMIGIGVIGGISLAAYWWFTSRRHR